MLSSPTDEQTEMIGRSDSLKFTEQVNGECKT